MERYYIICNDAESAWERAFLNFFPTQKTITKYCLNFIDKQFIFVTKDNVDVLKTTSDQYYFYRCYNPDYYSLSEENMDRMIDWIRDKIIEADEEERKYIMETLGKTMIEPIFPPIMWIVPIKKVIFNNPATIVMWEDGTKTVVKAEGEDYDPEKGLAMAIAKKAFGNEGNYYNEFKKWLPKES